MSEFNGLCKKIKKTAAKVAKKTGETADMAVKYIKLQKIDSKLSDRYEMLGRLTYKQLKTGESYAEKIAIYIDSIDKDGTSIGVQELKILFETNALRNTNKMMELMTTSSDLVTLLKLNSEILSYSGMEIAQNCFLEFFSKKDKIKNSDFSDVRVRVIKNDT